MSLNRKNWPAVTGVDPERKAPAAAWTAGAREDGVEWRYLAFSFQTFRTDLLPEVTFFLWKIIFTGNP
jgi:hypothetical protein